MNEFKIGDIIAGLPHNGYVWTDKDMLKARVLSTFDNSMNIEILEHKDHNKIGCKYLVENTSNKFKKTVSNNLTKQQLLDMPIGTKIITDEKYHNIYIKIEKDEWRNDDSDHIYASDINEDLRLDGCYAYEILSVEEPTYRTVYEHQKESKEMTIAQIEKELGYSIKVVKESEDK